MGQTFRGRIVFFGMMRRMKSILNEVLRRFRGHEWWLVPFFIGAVFFLVQCSMISEYGATWDEPLHRNWGKLFALFWKSGNRELLSMMPGNGQYYSPLFFYLNYVLSEYLFKGHYLHFYEANHVLTLLTASVGVAFTFLLGRSIGGRRAGFFSVLFLVCFPQFIAHAHYNPKDIPLMTSAVVTAYVFLRALKTFSPWQLLLAAFLFGISIAMKVTAVLIAPAILAAFGLAWFLSPRPQKDAARDIGFLFLLGGIALLGLFLAWPSAWGDPLLVWRSIVFFSRPDFWPGKLLFFGVEYRGADLPWLYTPLEYLMGMPVLWMTFLVAGFSLFVRSLLKKQRLVEYSFLLLWILVPILTSLKPGLVRYDGMRQFYFVLPALAVVAAMGLSRFLPWIRHITKWKWTPVVVIVILLGSFTHEIALLHPYEGSYRNEVVRMAIPNDMDKSLQIEYWGATYREGMEWLGVHAELHPVICVPTAGVLVSSYPWREDFTFDCNAKTNYVMFFTRYSELDQKPFENLSPVFEIRRMNSALLKIYKVK